MLTGVVVAGVCAAVVAAGDSGVHEVSGTAALCAFADQNATSYRLSGIGWRREGRRAPGSAGVYPYGVYPCKDGQVALIGRSTKDWVEIATALGAHDALEAYPDPFAIATSHADEVDALLLPHLARHTRADVAELAETSGVLVAPVAEMADVLGYRDVPGQRPYFTEESGLVVPGLPMQVQR
jgi:crotonobetainyl-CoA:carnitine CoA-transferase CaiB-like acyl-CoA transferase